jgi:hypothetical protein
MRARACVYVYIYVYTNACVSMRVSACDEERERKARASFCDAMMVLGKRELSRSAAKKAGGVETLNISRKKKKLPLPSQTN